MEHSALLVGILVLLAVLVVLAWAYNSCRLDSVLSARLQKCQGSGGSAKDGMVRGLGAAADRPDMIPPYMAQRNSLGQPAGFVFNAGTYA